MSSTTPSTKLSIFDNTGSNSPTVLEYVVYSPVLDELMVSHALIELRDGTYVKMSNVSSGEIIVVVLGALHD